jgi:hypothetical protein
MEDIANMDPKQYSARASTELVWMRTRTEVGLLRTRQRNLCSVNSGGFLGQLNLLNTRIVH